MKNITAFLGVLLVIGAFVVTSVLRSIAALANIPEVSCERDLIQKYSFEPTAPWQSAISQDLQGQSEIIEAAPSDEVGTWLEKRHNVQTGNLEIRKVSAQSTRQLIFDPEACHLISQTFYGRSPNKPLIQGGNDFSDETLKSLLESGSEAVIYSWSPNMPLSLKGLKEIRTAAASLGIPVIYVLDPHVSEARAQKAIERYGLPKSASQHIESVDLYYRGMALHYPTLLFTRSGSVVGSVVHGFHWADQFKKIMEHKRSEQSLPATYVRINALNVKMAQHKITVLSKVPTKNSDFYFFRPVFGTQFVAFSHDENKLFDLKRRKEIELPCCYDPTPTPDAKYLIIPTDSQDNAGEACFYEMKQILSARDASRVKPIMCDRQIRSDYLFAATFENGSDASSYRLAGSKSFGDVPRFALRYRDYKITHRQGKVGPKISPIGDAVNFCGGKNVHPSVPMISPNGAELAAEDDGNGDSTRIFKLDTKHPERCDVTLDFGIQVSKMAFDPTSSRVTFYANSFRGLPEGNSSKISEEVYMNAFVLDRKTNEVIPLTDNQRIRRASYPAFLENGDVIYHDMSTEESHTGQSHAVNDFVTIHID